MWMRITKLFREFRGWRRSSNRMKVLKKEAGYALGREERKSKPVKNLS